MSPRARRSALLPALVLFWTAAAWSAELPRFDCVITPFKMADVASPVAGVLEAVHVDRSDRVEQGQVVATLDSGVERASLELAQVRSTMENEIHLGKINLAFDEREKARLDSLYTKKVASFHDKDRAERDAALSRWKLRQAHDVHKLRELELRKAEEVLKQKTVRSPIEGVVLERYKTAGEYVEDQPVLRLAQLNPLYVEAIVPMEHFGKIHVGMAGEVVPETILKHPHRATVRVVDWMGNAASGTFGVRLELPNPDYQLPAGQKCLVRFLMDTAPPPALPRQAQSQPEPPMPGAVIDPQPPGWDLAAREQAPEQPAVAAVNPVKPMEPGPEAGAPMDEAGTAFEADNGEPVADIAPEPPVEFDSTPVSTLAAIPPSIAGACHALGPLESVELADQLSALLLDSGFRVNRREASEAVPTGYIVQTPYQESRQGVRELADHLREQGIRDMQIMGRGAHTWRLSLGYYRNEKLAYLRHESLWALGVETKVVVQSKSRISWWLDLVPASEGIPEDALREILDGIVVGLEAEPIDCPPVLTAQK